MSDSPQRTPPPLAGGNAGSNIGTNTGTNTGPKAASTGGTATAADVREASAQAAEGGTSAPTGAASAPGAIPEERSGPSGERIDRGIADFVKRAVSAGVGAAARSKEDIVRVAATEVRSWLDHMNISEEIAKALSHMVIEVKTEIRFRPSEDGRLVPQTSSDMKVKGSDS
ncbi:MAG TPA: hypothetical protein VIU64_09035 [Polyangia bacterium]